MDIAGKARKLERRISRTVDAAVEEFMGRSATAPLEIVHAVLDRAEHEIQEIGRGRRVFPFNRVRVLVVAGPGRQGSPRAIRRGDRRAAVVGGAARRSAAVGGVRGQRDWNRGRVCAAARHAIGPTRISTSSSIAPVSLPALPPADAGCRRRAQDQAGGDDGTARNIARIRSAADASTSAAGAEVVDQRQRLIRTNHVAFSEEGPDANQQRVAPARAHRIQRRGIAAIGSGTIAAPTGRASSAAGGRSRYPQARAARSSKRATRSRSATRALRVTLETKK